MMKQHSTDRAEGEEDVGERCSHTTGIVIRNPMGRVVAFDPAKRTADGPPWELVEAYLQSGKSSERLDDWQRRSPGFAGALRALRSLDSAAGEPSPAAVQSSRRAPSWLLRSPARQDGEDR